MHTYYSYRSSTPVRHTKLKRRPKPLFLIVGVLAMLIGAKAIIAANSQSASPGVPPSLAASAAAEEPAPKPKKAVDTSTLQASLEKISKQYPYNTSVVVIDLNSGNSVQTGDNAPYVAASTTKLLTALFYLDRVEDGKESLNKTMSGKPAQEHLRLMINRSDNTSWHLLNDYLGKQNLEAYARANGLKTYDAQKNTVSSEDIARLVAAIYKRELLNEGNTALLLSWMQNTSEERFIPPGIPDGIKLYHKSGYLNDRVHDVAVVDNGSAPFVLVIYSKSYTNSYDYLTGQKLYKQLTTQVFNTFNK